METIQCPHCNNSVPYDGFKEKQFCLSCGEILPSRNTSQGDTEKAPIAPDGERPPGCLTGLGAICALLAGLIFLIAMAFMSFPASEPYYSFSIKLGAVGIIAFFVGKIIDAMKQP